MASTIVTKNSSTASAVPVSGDLTQGELAINVTDKKLYTKDNGGSVVKIVGSLGNQESNSVTVSGGAINGTTVGAVTPSTGAFTTLAASGAFSLSGDQVQVTEGGTGSSSASGARTNLGLVIGTDVQAYNANTAVTNTAQTFTSAQTFRAASAIRSEAASTQDAVVVAGRAGGSNSYATTLTPATLSANRTVTIPDETFTVGFRNIFAVGTKTGSYTLAVGDVGKYVQLGSGGSITIPTSTFAEGDAISLFNNTTGNITITCSAPTAYIAGTDTIKTSMTLATRGVATVLFISATLCVVSGNVS